jgi:hypothetical protein
MPIPGVTQCASLPRTAAHRPSVQVLSTTTDFVCVCILAGRSLEGSSEYFIGSEYLDTKFVLFRMLQPPTCVLLPLLQVPGGWQ